MENENLNKNEATAKTGKEESKRPRSYYENNLGGNKDARSSNNNVNKECKFADSPSQAHCLNTTVPQNIAKQELGSKHTPTRSSLRHSRMIVLNREGQVTSSDVPFFLRYHKAVKAVRILIMLLAVFLCMLSVWLLMWSPNIRSRDNPYWSAIPVVISGIFGIKFIYLCPKAYSRRNVTCWIRSMKYVSILASVVAATAAVTVFAFAGIHLYGLYTMTCSNPEKLNSTCLCSQNSTTSTLFSDYHYVDLLCSEVTNVLSVLVAFNGISNAVIALLEVVYLYWHWIDRKVYIYTRVPVNGDVLKLYETKR